MFKLFRLLSKSVLVTKLACFNFASERSAINLLKSGNWLFLRQAYSICPNFINFVIFQEET